MSTQDRAVRGEGGHEAAADAGEREASGGAASGFEPSRLRAMQRRWIQRKANGGGGGAATIPTGAGAALGGGVQGRMERTLGADLSGVRVHTGGDSAEAAEAMGARAFTVGSDVHFGRGEFAPGSKEGDRLLAHELTHVVQGQKSGVQRKPLEHGGGGGGAAHDSDAAGVGGGEHGAAEHGDHEAGGHEVSEPGDASEQEADEMGDHAADELHGGDQAAGDHAGTQDAAKGGGGAGNGAHAGKKISRKPQIGAPAPSVGRKIFLAKAPSAPTAKPQPAGATAPAAQQGGLSPADARKIDQIKASLSTAGAEPLTLSALKLYQPEIDRLTAPKGGAALDPKALELKQVADTKRKSVEQAFDQTMTTATALIAAINVEPPDSFTHLQSALRNPAVDRWSLTATLDFRERPTSQAFTQAKTSKDKTIRTKHDEVMKNALQGIKAVPNEADPQKPGENPSAKAEAEFAKVRPWIGKIQDQVIFEQTVQDAFAEKLRQIHEAAAKPKQPPKGGAADAAAGAHGGGQGPAGKQGATPSAAAAPAAVPVPSPPKPAPVPQPPPPPAAHAQTPAGGQPPTATSPDAHAGGHDAHSSSATADTHTPSTANAGGAGHSSGPDAHAKGDHGAAATEHGGHGGHGNPETEALSAQHQELVALVEGMAATAQAKGIAADNAINVGLTGLGVAASLALTPAAGALIGGASFLISRWIGKEKREKQKHAREIIEMIQTIEDPAEIDKILALYTEGETDLSQIQKQVANALQSAPPAAHGAKGEKPEQAEAPAGNRTPAHGGAKGAEKKQHGDEHEGGEGEGHEGSEHGDEHHGGAAHRLHQGEEALHVGHVAAEGISAASHGLHHALEPILGPVAGVIAAFKLGLGISEYRQLRGAIAKKKQIEDQLKSKGAVVGPQQAAGGTPPGGKH